MDEKELIKERFKLAIASAVKAISENYELDIKFNNNQEAGKNTLNLPEISEFKDLHDFTKLRALADSEALKIKYTSKKIYTENEPKGKMAKSLYAIAEKIRYEKIGADRLKGIRNNLVQYHENKYKNKKIQEIKTESDVNITEAFELYLRTHFFNLKQNKITKEILSYWKDLFDKNIKKNLNELNNSVNDQKKFANHITRLIENLEFEDSESNEKEEKQENDHENSKSENNSDDMDSKSDADNNEEQQTNANLNIVDNNFNLLDDDNADEKELENIESELNTLRKNTTKLTKDKYKIFTNEFDEIKKAEDLEKEEELAKLRKLLDQQLTNLQDLITKLANKLQRQLLAKQNRSWEFDLEEGILDASKLARVVIDPFHSLSYKDEKETDFKDTVVSVLIDNSGSMRGRPISVAAICADILSRTLERCSVKVEVLGFTTKNWKGGKSREKWNLNNKPSNPGRLNDLRHIIYKSADAPWRQSKKNLGLMLKEGLLKENIDGEALLWAFKRISKRKEERKILMVISDGAPVDDSTLSVNSGNYLEKHLKQTVKWIEENSNIEILAIGIGHDVTRYYNRAIKITDVQELGDVMINQLTDLFSDKKNKTIH
tara:strand:- start:1126 stop:2940 length:1815 start_codon:yes stop_codon:yes gene_type:complete